MVTVVCGADREEAAFAGRTVAEVRTAYEHVFNIAPDAIAKVNGQQVQETHVLKDNDKLEFSKVAVKARECAA